MELELNIDEWDLRDISYKLLKPYFEAWKEVEAKIKDIKKSHFEEVEAKLGLVEKTNEGTKIKKKKKKSFDNNRSNNLEDSLLNSNKETEIPETEMSETKFPETEMSEKEIRETEMPETENFKLRKDLTGKGLSTKIYNIRRHIKGASPIKSLVPLKDNEEIYKKVFDLNYSNVLNDTTTKDFILHDTFWKNYIWRKGTHKGIEKWKLGVKKRLNKLVPKATFGIESYSGEKIYQVSNKPKANDSFTIHLEGDFINPVSEDFKILVHNDVKPLINWNVNIQTIKHQNGDTITGTFYIKSDISMQYWTWTSIKGVHDMRLHLDELENIFLKCLKKYEKMMNEIMQAKIP